MKTYSYVVKHVEGNIKKQLQYLHKIFERRPKDVWKLYLGYVHIMMFYGSSKNVNLTDSIKFITATFLMYHDSVQEAKTFGIILSHPRSSVLNIIQSTLLLYYFPSYAPNVLREILKS